MLGSRQCPIQLRGHLRKIREKLWKRSLMIASDFITCAGANTCNVVPVNKICNGYFDCMDREHILSSIQNWCKCKTIFNFRSDESGCNFEPDKVVFSDVLNRQIEKSAKQL